MNADEVACPDCAETIKSAARVCRHCGWRREAVAERDSIMAKPQYWSADEWRQAPKGNCAPKERTSFIAKLGSAAVLVVFIISSAFAILRYHNITQNIDPATQRVAQRYISATLKDPLSAQFDDVHTSKDCVTGQVNMRNGFGGYIGFREFYYDAKRNTGAIKPDDVRLDLDDPSTIAAVTASSNYLNGKSACQGTEVLPTATAPSAR